MKERRKEDGQRKEEGQGRKEEGMSKNFPVFFFFFCKTSIDVYIGEFLFLLVMITCDILHQICPNVVIALNGRKKSALSRVRNIA